MPWNETTPMDQKMQFIADYLRGELSVTELCGLYGVAHKTGYKFIARYLNEDPEGLEERSRRPENYPRHTAAHIGFFAYHAVPTNRQTLSAFRDAVVVHWQRTLSRRSQNGRIPWARMVRLAAAWLPPPRILHPWPRQRFDVTHPRREPSARIGPARFCAGGVQ